MPLDLINNAKESIKSFQPLLLAVITFAGGTVLRLSTHPLNAAEGGAQYGGNDYLGRIVDQQISIVQGYDPGGIDVIPAAALTIADPDKLLKTTYDDVYGFAGATLELTFVFWDAGTSTFSSDSILKFTGICDPAKHEVETMTISATSKLNLQRRFLPSVPLQRRCPWNFPTTVEQRQAAADDEDSIHVECGYSPDATGGNARGNFESGSTPFASCDRTKAACVARGMYTTDGSARVTGRFGGTQWDTPPGQLSRDYVSGTLIQIENADNRAKYGRPVPMVYGTAWVEAVAVNVVGDGNSTRGEAILCLGEVQSIQKLVVNGVQLPPANDITGGTNYVVRDALLRYNVINRGDRDGSPNLDAPYNGNGDPYGSMATILWVVPRRVAEANSIPKIQALVDGPKIRVYEDVDTYAREFSSNPAWVLMDLLIWSGLSYVDLDVQTFIDAAEICDVPIDYVDQNGNTSQHARFSCSLVLNQKRSAAEIIRGVRQSFGGILVPNSSSGKLQLFVEGTLASQQFSAEAGSNHVSAIASQTLDGVATNGYLAYDFTKFLARNGQNSLAIDTQPNAAAPNRVQFPFINSEREYSSDSLAMTDTDAVALIGQEVDQAFDALGINTLDQAKRVARRTLARGLRGNVRGDAGGTELVTWEDSFRLIRLRAGHLCRISNTHFDLSNVMVRILQIRPTKNFERVVITAQRHSDAWYLDTYGQEDDPASSVQFRNRLDRPSYPWGPAIDAPAATDPMLDETEKTWQMDQQYDIKADETGMVLLNLTGRQPVNIFSPVSPPIVGRQGTTASSGGSIKGGRAYYFSICTEDSDGKLSSPSLLCKVEITNTGSANTATVPILSWPSGAAGYKLFGGDTPHQQTLQAEASGTPSSVTLTAYRQRDVGTPDPEFDRMRVKVKRIFHAGVFGQEIDEIDAGEITVGDAGWAADEWVGRTVSVIGKEREGYQEVWNFLVTGNTDETLSVTPDPVAAGVEILDVVVMRSIPTVGSDGGGNYVADDKWQNSLDGNGLGLNEDEEKGRLLRFIAGPGRGDVYRIKANTATAIYIDGEWLHTPDETSVFVVEEPDWQVIQTSDSLNNADFESIITLQAEVTNYSKQTCLVQVFTVDGGGNESMDALSPWREIYIFGEPANGPYEQATFALAMCNPLAVGEDLTNRAPVETAGTCFRCSVNPKTASAGARVVIDLSVSRDGGETKHSIFPDGNDNKIVIPADSTGHYFFTGFNPDWALLEENDLIIADVLEAGEECTKVSVKLMWRRLGGRAGNVNVDFEMSLLAAAIL